MLHQFFGPLTRFEHFSQVLSYRDFFPHLYFGKFGVAHDNAEDIVEIVGYSSSKRAECFQFLSLPELCFGPVPFLFQLLSPGNITAQKKYARTHIGRFFNKAHRNIQKAVLAVRMNEMEVIESNGCVFPLRE